MRFVSHGGFGNDCLRPCKDSHQDGGGIPVPSAAVLPTDDEKEMADFLNNKEIYLGGYEPLSRTFRYTDAFVHLESFLPTQRDYFGSCLIRVKQSNLDGCSSI